MKKERLLELAGVTEQRDPFKAKGADPFKDALRTIAQELVSELSERASPEEVEEVLQGRWIEMLRDEINDLLAPDSEDSYGDRGLSQRDFA